MESIFKNWKCRASSLGNIMTNLPSKDEKDKIKKEIKALENERDFGINANGNKVKWTENKAIKLADLIAKRDTKDQLPTGAKSYLDNEFRAVFWGRRRFLDNKYLQKGTISESDGLALISELDGTFYSKNEEHLENEWIQGTPDNRQGKIRDIKCSWDLESFEKSELSTIYKWQIKGYMWMDKKTKGELDYCLVNNPKYQIIKEKERVLYAMGYGGQAEDVDETNPRYLEAIQQVEKNMIFNLQEFRDVKELDVSSGEYIPVNKNYDLDITDWDFDIPTKLRVKRFDVELFPEDIAHIKRRVELSREYLINKEKEVFNIINN